ncbi:MAG: DNA repair protein RadA, partial [candidate division WOR-3 bacterium]
MRKVHFVCQNCGYESPRWLGRCPNCESWNTLTEEEVIPKKLPRSKHSSDTCTSPKRLAELSLTPVQRLKTGIGELDRVLGGGIVPGSLLLLGGEPGIGKSTLLFQVCRNLARNKI